MRDFPGSPGVRIRFHCRGYIWVSSLVGKLRSHSCWPKRKRGKKQRYSLNDVRVLSACAVCACDRANWMRLAEKLLSNRTIKPAPLLPALTWLEGVPHTEGLTSSSNKREKRRCYYRKNLSLLWKRFPPLLMVAVSSYRIQRTLSYF